MPDFLFFWCTMATICNSSIYRYSNLTYNDWNYKPKTLLFFDFQPVAWLSSLRFPGTQVVKNSEKRGKVRAMQDYRFSFGRGHDSRKKLLRRAFFSISIFNFDPIIRPNRMFQVLMKDFFVILTG